LLGKVKALLKLCELCSLIGQGGLGVFQRGGILLQSLLDLG